MKRANLGIFYMFLSFTFFLAAHANINNDLVFIPCIFLGFCVLAFDITRVTFYNLALDNLIEP